MRVIDKNNISKRALFYDKIKNVITSTNFFNLIRLSWVVLFFWVFFLGRHFSSVSLLIRIRVPRKYLYSLGWRKNNSYFYFPSHISNRVIYSIKKISTKGKVKQKIFSSKALKIFILFKMMNFFLHLYRYLELAQELRKFVIVAKKN